MEMDKTNNPIIKNSGILKDAPNKIEGRALLACIKEESITAAFFDPQYRGVLDKLSYGNEGKTRGKKRAALSQMSIEDIIEFINGISKALIKSGHLFLWVDKFHLCEGVLPWLCQSKLELVDMIVWDKERIGMGYRTRRRGEYLLVLQKPPKRAAGLWVDHSIPDIWQEKVEKGGHTHKKPLCLQQRLICAVSNEGDWILDPAAGSYSVLTACKLCNRHFIGGDIEG